MKFEYFGRIIKKIIKTIDYYKYIACQRILVNKKKQKNQIKYGIIML